MITNPGVSAIKSQAMQTVIQPTIVVTFLILVGGWVIFTTWTKK